MTKIQWAYPENPENLFPYDGTGETAKALFLEAGYSTTSHQHDDLPATSDKAGQQVTIRRPCRWMPRTPAGSVLINAQAVLATIGVSWISK
jgi:hypothetical protein